MEGNGEIYVLFPPPQLELESATDINLLNDLITYITQLVAVLP